MLVVEMSDRGVVVACDVAERPVHERKHASPICADADVRRVSAASVKLEGVDGPFTAISGDGQNAPL